MISSGLKQLLNNYKYRKVTERLCNCITYFPQLENFSKELLSELIDKYTYNEKIEKNK